MNKKETYFFPLKEYSTWEWTIDQHLLVVQFVNNGPTIVYQNELIPILKEVQEIGLPYSFDVILLLIHALKSKTGEYVPEYLKKVVLSLPDKLKKTQDFPYIIKLIIQRVIEKEYLFSSLESRELIDDFLASPLKNFLPKNQPEKTNASGLNYFENEFQECFPTQNDLLVFLETGLTQLPTLKEVEIPTISSNELFSELANEKDTKGIFDLVQEITAAIKIPMNLKSGGDRPLGGFSDITNKGTVDKLLLTELAYDDVFFMARLVNNESLYFRRETPPPDEHESKNVLIDTSLRMWGIPHVFANSIALACYQKYHQKWLPTVYSLGEDFVQEDLTTTEGIIDSLKKVNGELDCMNALLDFLAQKKEDSIFITNPLFIQSEAYLQKAHLIQEQLKFLITVERNGEMTVYECLRGLRKEISKNQFDLTKTLFTVQIKDYKKKRTTNNTTLPPLWQKEHFPLLFPAMRIQISAQKTFFIEKPAKEGSHLREYGTLAITDNFRVLYWKGRDYGAREILAQIEDGFYYFGYLNERIYILILNYDKTNIQKLYRINLNDYSYQTISLNTISLSSSIVNVQFKDNNQEAVFHLHTSQNSNKNVTYCINCELASMIEFPKIEYTMGMFFKKQVSKMLNNGYNVFQNPFSAYIVDSTLVIGNYYLDRACHFQPIKEIQIKGRPKQQEALFIEETNMVHAEKPALQFQSATFEDGSQIILDNYGFGHFISANEEVPPFVMALFITKQTMGYVESNKYYCGNEYFKDLEKFAYHHFSHTDFFDKYWTRFINQIIATTEL